jgi:hypothetical protein
VGNVAAVTVHDFTPYYSSLQHLYLPDLGIEIAHHFDGVRVGDRIIWGETVFDAATYQVVSVRTVIGLDDLWFARCARLQPAIIVAGLAR